MRRTFITDDRGAVAILASVAMTMLMGMCALAVDIGMLYLERRQAQGAVDLAAIAAAGNASVAQEIAEQVLLANGITGYTKLEILNGNYTPDPLIPHANRFTPNVAPLNAVRIELTKPGRTYFSNLFNSEAPSIGVTGLAANADFAIFSAGSRLLAFRDGLANRLLGRLLGGELSLSVADYESLLNAKIALAPFLEALQADGALTAATYNEVLSSELTLSDVARAAAIVADQNGEARASGALETLSRAAEARETPLDMGKIVNLGILGNAMLGSREPGLDAAVSALDLISSSAVVANEKNQVAVDLGATIPGLTSVKVDIAIGDPPVRSAWITVGQPGSTVYTAQIRIRVIAEIAGSGLLSGSTVRIPLYIEAAHASATLTTIRCEKPREVTIAGNPGVVSAYLADVTSFGATAAKPTVRRARLVKLPIAEVFGSARAAVEDLSPTNLVFSKDEIANQTMKRTGTSDLAASLVSSLAREAEIEVEALGLSVGSPSGLTNAVATVLESAAKPLDRLVSDILTSLGIHLGELDVRVHGLKCGTGYLAG